MWKQFGSIYYRCCLIGHRRFPWKLALKCCICYSEWLAIADLILITVLWPIKTRCALKTSHRDVMRWMCIRNVQRQSLIILRTYDSLVVGWCRSFNCPMIYIGTTFWKCILWSSSIAIWMPEYRHTWQSSERYVQALHMISAFWESWRYNYRWYTSIKIFLDFDHRAPKML